MPRRKELKGIASGIAGSFVSRNNDIDGYWAMGILHQLASELGNDKFFLNLMTGESITNFKYSKRVAQPYYEYLINQIGKKGLEEYQVTSAIVEIEFKTVTTKKHKLYSLTWGEPFVCKITITDDFGRNHICSEYGWCGSHDPKKEHRSTRRYAF